MRRKAAVLIAVCMLLSGCSGQTWEDDRIPAFSEEMKRIAPSSLEMQKQLARWYNVNLRSDCPEIGFERAYDSIWFFEDGMAGYVEFPETGIQLPIYHRMAEDGFLLDPYSSFPIGGAGDCTKLRISRPMELTEGDIFYLHVLGEVLTYRIGEDGADSCFLICDGTVYEGGRVVDD